jgi:ribonuclease HI
MNKSALSHFVLITDGGCRRNGQESPTAYGSFAVIAVAKDGTRETGMLRHAQYPDCMTNNQAEYEALLRGLVYLTDLVARLGMTPTIIINSDSELVCGQLNGSMKVKASGLKILNSHAKDLIAKLNADLHWRPREEIVAALGH